ncbi:vesicle transport protein USE1-like [Penaeus monodon]|uniref:vesicle transport protein USE1-like n=1 Tax=Penaeus monodon TaxID=6687 RepID=UPI0018A7281D|nr:vesicle transport protein USE1-like [Penaeus monodon]
MASRENSGIGEKSKYLEGIKNRSSTVPLQIKVTKYTLYVCPSTKVLDSGTATQMIPHGPATTSDHTVTQQIHQRTQAKTTNRLRQDLLGLDPDGESELHQRKGAYGGDVSADDFQRKMLNDEQKREKMVEDMIIMTREWKEQSRIANKIIKKDIDALDKSSKVADSNQTHLKVEANRLAEYNKRACNFWIWIMIIIVCFTFIGK